MEGLEEMIVLWFVIIMFLLNILIIVIFTVMIRKITVSAIERADVNFNEFVNEVKDNIRLFLPKDYENAEVSTMECQKQRL